MRKPASFHRGSNRERLRWQRATDERLIEVIFGNVVRDVPLPAAAGCLTSGADPTVTGATPRS